MTYPSPRTFRCPPPLPVWMEEFAEEEPTKPEVTETLAETLARLRDLDQTRPSVRFNENKEAP